MPSIIGATHPLARAVLEADRAQREHRDRYATAAGAVLADHRQHGITDRSVYEISAIGAGELAAHHEGGYTIDESNWTAWRRLGSREDYGHLLDQPGYVDVSGRDSVAAVITRVVGPIRRIRAHELRDAAHIAAPMVSVLLALLVDSGAVGWDTDETVTQAGMRLAMDAAWRSVDQPNPPTTPRAVYEAVVDDLNLTDGYQDATPIARLWLQRHNEVTGRLAAQDITWGGPTLSAAEAADRAGVTRGTWTGYVTRGEGPSRDKTGPSRWYPSTVDAWRLTRARTPWRKWGM